MLILSIDLVKPSSPLTEAQAWRPWRGIGQCCGILRDSREDHLRSTRSHSSKGTATSRILLVSERARPDSRVGSLP